MLRRHTTYFFVLQSVCDITLIAGAWIAAYFVRFYSGVFTYRLGLSPFAKHLHLAPLVTLLCYLACSWSGLYSPRRLSRLRDQIGPLLKACAIGVGMIVVALYYLYSQPYSRILLVIFSCVLFCCLTLSRVLVTWVLGQLRQKGFNLGYYAVIGAGKEGQRLVHEMDKSVWSGMKCRFLVDNDPGRIGRTICGVRIVGPIDETTRYVSDNPVDEVYLALVGNEARSAYPVLRKLQNQGVTVRIIPDWGDLLSTNCTVVRIGSQMLFSAGDSALDGVNLLVKELFDRLAALILLTIFALPMAVIALLTRLSGEGPIFYRQVRFGLDQKPFQMLKFRTMPVGCEDQTGPVWALPDDPRRTRIGAWLRRTSLDELPQLINVLKGEMSLVGPRPERPEFAEQYSGEMKDYVLRHKAKAGMTGWAQIHGYRGRTSLKKRVQYDLYYIKNWSIGLDLRILASTPWHVIRGKHAS